MGSETNHSKIITKAAKSILQPMGLFQKGKSRVWIDDNDWFFTVVEFQPSGFTKGSHLNVAVDFLWHKTDHLAYHFHYGNSPRVNNFSSLKRINGCDLRSVTPLGGARILPLISIQNTTPFGCVLC